MEVVYIFINEKRRESERQSVVDVILSASLQQKNPSAAVWNISGKKVRSFSRQQYDAKQVKRPEKQHKAHVVGKDIWRPLLFDENWRQLLFIIPVAIIQRPFSLHNNNSDWEGQGAHNQLSITTPRESSSNGHCQSNQSTFTKSLTGQLNKDFCIYRKARNEPELQFAKWAEIGNRWPVINAWKAEPAEGAKQHNYINISKLFIWIGCLPNHWIYKKTEKATISSSGQWFIHLFIHLVFRKHSAKYGTKLQTDHWTLQDGLTHGYNSQELHNSRPMLSRFHIGPSLLPLPLHPPPAPSPHALISLFFSITNTCWTKCATIKNSSANFFPSTILDHFCPD